MVSYAAIVTYVTLHSVLFKHPVGFSQIIIDMYWPVERVVTLWSLEQEVRGSNLGWSNQTRCCQRLTAAVTFLQKEDHGAWRHNDIQMGLANILHTSA